MNDVWGRQGAFDRLVPTLYGLWAFLFIACVVVFAQGRWSWLFVPVLLVLAVAVWMGFPARREDRLGKGLASLGVTLADFGLLALAASQA